jgi:small conductance mechanosensitive channel
MPTEVIIPPMLATLAAISPTLLIPPAATTQPSTQPVEILVPVAPQGASPNGSASLIDAFGHTRLVQMVEGKQTATLHDMLQPDFWIDTIKELVVAAISFIPSLLGALLFLLIFWVVYRAVRRILIGAMQRANVDTSIRDMLVTLSKWIIMGFGVVIACNQVGIPIVAMLTGVSILGLAVGFAAQETLANFIAGIVIFWDKPFKVGDWITVEGTYAQMQRITFRSCRMLNLEGEVIILPNTSMLANKVANHSTHPVSRINISVGITYEASISTARAALLKTTQGDPRVRPSPPPEVIVDKLADSSVDLLLRFWIDDEKIERKIHFEYNEKAKLALDEAKVDIAYPHLQLVNGPGAALSTSQPG